jgi:hypothetical protein
MHTNCVFVFQLSVRNEDDGNISRGRISSTGSRSRLDSCSISSSGSRSRIDSCSSASKPEVAVFIDPPNVEKENSQPPSENSKSENRSGFTVKSTQPAGHRVLSRSPLQSKNPKLKNSSSKKAVVSIPSRVKLEAKVSSIENIRVESEPSLATSSNCLNKLCSESIKIETGEPSEVFVVNGENNEVFILNCCFYKEYGVCTIVRFSFNKHKFQKLF